jgi:rhodanese-related sulfurtransferase
VTEPSPHQAFSAVSPAAVRAALLDYSEIGFIDVRPESAFAAGHPLFAASFPVDRLEADAFDRLPRRAVPLVVYGDGGADADAAAARLGRLGFTDVSLLAGGLAGWVAAGGELFRDVNVPSKAFGELVASVAGTPSVTATELADMIARRADVLVVDARRFDEYQTMSIPTATSVPGAELVLRVPGLAADAATTVVVNCAGRTRSIIGAQSLINAGLPNDVKALRNGTMGWLLAGLELDHGGDRPVPTTPPDLAGQAKAAAAAVAARAGVRSISAGQLRAVIDGGQRTVYRFDVRSPAEYEAGHLPGFRSAPGGQLVQETDRFAPVRGALVVLAADEGGRAPMTASWLAQMGWETALLPPPGPAAQHSEAEHSEAEHSEAEHSEALQRGPWRPQLPSPPAVPVVTAAEVADWVGAGHALVIDVDTSTSFLAGHLPGAAWALRSDLSGGGVPGLRSLAPRLILTSSDGFLAKFAAADLAGQLPTDVMVLAGGTEGWVRSGRSLQAGPGPLLSARVDVYRRPYEGTDADHSAMQAYLDWESGLVAQLERDGTHGFTVLIPEGTRSRSPRPAD